ncbi:MAG: bifunctional 4-hydroxy-3-methylbut-2-enyl diphosphate reductase/30S ribosomal protein S1 [Oscillospiraceae bacterium]|nr:bifunctional 4-hydroxy-3-methylbut-2-enyl diphosphate reductase/30S ribosomal protein S1 [Oscillospiraceae bacterium]
MELRLAKSAGFCFGVRRAVTMTEKALAAGPVWSLGELIHNGAEVSRLGQAGLQAARSAEEVPAGVPVVLRSHGVSRRERELLEEKGCRIIDATCPRVARIHQIVARASAQGRQVVIFGEPSHPEVQGITGWCQGAVVTPDLEAFRRWAEEVSLPQDAELTVVFQTTSNKENSEQNINSLKKVYTKARFFDTICEATSLRQNEARQLSGECSAMVVVGGLHSANSVHLAEICRQHCEAVLFVQNADELELNALSGFETVGITAGASTPSWIIKEVVSKMNESEIVKDEPVVGEDVAVEETAPAVEEAPAEEAAPVEAPAAEETPAETAPAAEEAPANGGEMTFDQMLEESIKTIHNGDTVTGVVAGVGATEISIDLPTKHSGYIPASEFTNDQPGVDINDLVKVGEEIQAIVVQVNDVEGTVKLSKRRLDAERNWREVQTAMEEGAVLEGRVSEENKGGVVINQKGVRIFIPASQTGLNRGEPMTGLVGQTVRFRITEVDEKKHKRVVGSIRSVLVRERKEKAEKIWAEIEKGKVYQGTVKSMTSYGAFVDIGGVDGMVHVSEISWERIRKPEDVLSVGQEVEVYVINFDPEKKKISLGYRKPEDNPWLKFTEAYSVGDVATVKVVKLMPFGAFAEVLPGVDGLIHISQIANRRIGKPDEVLSVGQEVDAKITAIDNDKQKISLSIRALIEPEPAPARSNNRRGDRERDRDRKPEPRGDALVYEISATGEATGIAPEEDEIIDED